MVKMLFIGLVVGLLVVGGIGLVYNVVDDINNEELKINKNYTPSQNLAIFEGRFDDAFKSIQDDRSKW